MHRTISDILDNIDICDGSLMNELRGIRSSKMIYEWTGHPYGFLIARIAANSKPYKLRLHYWSDQTRCMQNPVWLPHSHNSNMRSIVLFGSLSNHIGQFCEDASERQCLYKVGYEGDASVIRKTNKIGKFKWVSEELVGSGCQYMVPSGVFHSTNVDEGVECLTLAIFDNFDQGVATVVGDRFGLNSYKFYRDNVDFEVGRRADKLVNGVFCY